MKPLALLALWLFACSLPLVADEVDEAYLSNWPTGRGPWGTGGAPMAEPPMGQVAHVIV